MGLFRIVVQVAADSTLPRDRIVNTFHLNKETVPVLSQVDADALAQDTANLFTTSWYGPTREVRVKVYKVGPPPQYPLAEKVNNIGLAPASSGPREIALCLSYCGVRNLPRTRGRMFLAMYPSIQSANVATLRPSSALRSSAIALAGGIAGLGGVDVDWSVYSPTTGEHEAVKTAWVDDEWDTVRSRGLRPTTRSTGAYNG